MKKILFFVGLVLLCLFVGSVSAMSGNGDADNPWIITTPADLRALSGTGLAGYGANAYYELGADIDMSSVASFPPIGTDSNWFTGHFDGKNHTISNLTILNEEPAGLFAYSGGSDIRNIIFRGAYVNVNTGSTILGTTVLVGRKLGTITITNVHVYDSYVNTNMNRAALLVGSSANANFLTYIDSCTGDNCYISCGIQSYGLTVDSSTIMSNCTLRNSIVSGVGGYIGGLSGGGNITNSNVINCYINGGLYQGATYIGGICSFLNTVNNCNVESSTIVGYSCGGIYGTDNSGGTGRVTGCTVSYCSIIGTSNVGGVGV